RPVRYEVPAEDRRRGCIGVPCPIRYVVLPEYDLGSMTRLRPVSRATALMRLGEQTFDRAQVGGGGITMLADVVGGAECFELPIGDLQEAIQAVRSLFAP